MLPLTLFRLMMSVSDAFRTKPSKMHPCDVSTRDTVLDVQSCTLWAAHCALYCWPAVRAMMDVEGGTVSLGEVLAGERDRVLLAFATPRNPHTAFVMAPESLEETLACQRHPPRAWCRRRYWQQTAPGVRVQSAPRGFLFELPCIFDSETTCSVSLDEIQKCRRHAAQQHDGLGRHLQLPCSHGCRDA